MIFKTVCLNPDGTYRAWSFDDLSDLFFMMNMYLYERQGVWIDCFDNEEATDPTYTMFRVGKGIWVRHDHKPLEISF